MSIARRARRLARLLICAVAWILLFNLCATTGNHFGPWSTVSALALGAPFVAYVTYPLFTR